MSAEKEPNSPTLESFFKTTMGGMHSFRSGDLKGGATMTPKTRQREIKRITSNLPEVYNRYFMTMGPTSATKDELNQAST